MKDEGKKLINCYVESETFETLKTLKNHYKSANRGHLIDVIIKELYNYIEKDKQEDEISTSRLDYLEDKLEKLERKVEENILSLGKKPKSLFNEEEIHNIIKNLKSKGLTTLQISKELNDQGYKTRSGLDYSQNTVQKEINKIDGRKY